MAWNVVAQLVTQGRDEQGNLVKGVEVTYETDAGLRDSLFFPMTEYTEANVRAALADINATHDAVGRLNG